VAREENDLAIRVTCTQCGSAYKIDETKIPSTGGAVKCQACGTRFAVMPPQSVPPQSVPPQSAPSQTAAPTLMLEESTTPGGSGPLAPRDSAPIELPGVAPSLLVAGTQERSALPEAPRSPSDLRNPGGLSSFSEPNDDPGLSEFTDTRISLENVDETQPIAVAKAAPSIALPSFSPPASIALPSVQAPVASIALPSTPAFALPSIPMPGAPSPAAPFGPQGPSIALPSVPAPSATAAIAPAAIVPPLMTDEPASSEITRPNVPRDAFSGAIALPSAPPADEDSVDFDEEEVTQTKITAPPMAPVHDDAPSPRDEVLEEAEELVDDSDIEDDPGTQAISLDDLEHTGAAKPKPSMAFDDLPAPAADDKGAHFAPPGSPPQPDFSPPPQAMADEDTIADDGPQFSGITLHNVPAPRATPEDLPVSAKDEGSAPLSLGPVKFEETTMGDDANRSDLDDLPANLSDAPPQDDADDLPSPLEASSGDDAVPEPMSPSELGLAAPGGDDDLPPPLESEGGVDDMPDPMAEPRPAALRRRSESFDETEATDVGEDAERQRQRNKVRTRIALASGLVALITVGGLVASWLMTGAMPWSTPIQAPAVATPAEPTLAAVPPAPDWAAIEGQDLDVFQKALASLDERKAARKARNEPEETREDQALRARIVWHGAVLQGSRSMQAMLSQLQKREAGVEPHPNEERAEAALAFVVGDLKGMSQKLDKLLARDKGDKDAHLLYGYALLKNEDTVNAGKHFDEVLRIDEVNKTGPKSVDALLGQAEIARRTGDLDSAASFLEKAEEFAKARLRVRLLRAELDHENGQRDAEESGVRALSASVASLGERDRARFHFLRAAHAASLANAKGAKADLETAWEEDPQARIARALIASKLARNETDDVDTLIAAGRKLDDGAYAESFYLAEVTRAVLVGDFNKAKDIAIAGAKSGIEKRTVFYGEGLSLEAQKKLPFAMKAYAASAKADKLFALPVLADIRLKKQPPKVKLLRLQLVAKTTGDARALAALGDALYETQAWGPAAEKLQAALDKDPFVLDFTRVGVRLADAYQKSGNKRASARMAIGAVNVDPKSVLGILQSVEVAKAGEAYEDALKQVEEGLETNPSSVELQLAKADVMILRNNREKARSLLQGVLKTNEKNPRAHELLALSYHPNDPDLVKLHIKNAIDLAPTEPRYHFLLGQAYFNKEKYEEARDAFERTLELDPKSVDATLMLARVADMQGRKKEAIDRYRRVLELDPERKQIVPELAERLEDSGLKKDALDLLMNASKRDPNNGALFIGIGRIHQATGNKPLAIKFFKQALKTNPNDAQAFYRLGYLYKDSSNAKEAKKSFEMYLKLNPKADDRKEIESEIAELR
jgi:predicted Zn finger-like uncharacterized protein